MSTSTILNIPLVAPNQTNKETTINTAISILERALNDVAVVDTSVGDVTLSVDDFVRYGFFEATPPAARVISVASRKRIFGVRNRATVVGRTLTVRAVGTATTASVVVGIDTTVLLVCNGDPANPRLEKLADSTVASVDLESFLGLNDTPNGYTGQAGKALVVNATENGIEFGTITLNFLGLTDTPDSFNGQANCAVYVNAAGTGLEFRSITVGVSKFADLSDGPGSLAGQSGKLIRVNGAGNALEFAPVENDTITENRSISLINPSFEATDGWTGSSGSAWTQGGATDNLGTITAADDGTAYIYTIGAATPLLAPTYEQTIDLTETASALDLDDGATVLIEVAARTITRSGDPYRGKIFADFLDAAGETLTTIETNAFANTASWIDYTLAGPVPVGARQLRLRLSAVPTDDGQAAYAFDTVKASLKIKATLRKTFLSLDDTPDSFAGTARRFVRVNAAMTAVEFATAALGDLSNVNTSGAGEGDFLVFQNAAWRPISVIIPRTINVLGDLDDVAMGTPTTGQFLRFNGTDWQPSNFTLDNVSLDALSDVSTINAQVGQVLTFTGAGWEPLDASGSGNGEGDPKLLNVFFDGGDPGYVLTFDGTQWTPQAIPTPQLALGDLTDVFTLTPAAGQVLRFDGTAWFNQTLPIQVPSIIPVNLATYSLSLADANNYIRMNFTAANTVVVPADATVNFPIGTMIHIRQTDNGKTTISPANNVVINTPETLSLRKRNSTASLIKIAINTWDLTGDLEAV